MNFSARHLKIGSVLFLFLSVAFLYYIRPFIQPLALFIYLNPFIIQALILSAVLSFLAYRFTDVDGLGSSAFTMSFVGFFFVGIILSSAYTNMSIAEDLVEDRTEISSLPDADNQNPRILPRTVSDEFAQNSLQEPRHKLGESDIAIDSNGTPQWSYPLRPDGFINSLSISQRGGAYIDMTSSSSDISYNDGDMDVGIGMRVRDNIDWQQRKQSYWKSYEDHFMMEHDGENYIATPYVDYSLEFRFPLLLMVPEWGGAVLTDEEGEMEYLESEEVSENEILQDQRVYPYNLARRYVSAMEYRNGVLNKWFFHEDQLEVAPLPGFDNDQPFTIMTDEGPQLFIATEPYGDASGLFEIWTVDGATGDYELYALDRQQGLIGAERAVNYVRQANSKVNWADEDSDTGFEPIEPLPVIVDDQLYWQVRVVPIDSAGIAFTSMVSAESSNVYTAETDQEIYEFLEGEDIGEADEQPTTEEGIEISVIEDGEVAGEITVTDPEFEIEVSEE